MYQRMRSKVSYWDGLCIHYSKPTPGFLNDCDWTYLLTPSTLNPHHDAYASNEEHMLNFKCNILEKNYMPMMLDSLRVIII